MSTIQLAPKGWTTLAHDMWVALARESVATRWLLHHNDNRTHIGQCATSKVDAAVHKAKAEEVDLCVMALKPKVRSW